MFVSVSVCGALWVPVTSVPKFKLLALSLTPGEGSAVTWTERSVRADGPPTRTACWPV